MYCAYFMLTPDSVEALNQHYDDMSCVTVSTGTTGIIFGRALDEDKSESKTKQTASASGHIQDFMGKLSHQLIKLEDLEHCHMNHYLGGGATYLGQHVKNKMMVKIPLHKKKTTKKGDMNSKVAR